jgi:transmembrane sensor
MNLQQLTDILNRYSAGECSAAEKHLVDAWYEKLVNTGELQWNEDEKALLQATIEARLLQSISQNEMPAAPRIRFIKRSYWWAAAAVLIMLAAGAYILNKQDKQPTIVKTKTPVPGDVAPGGDKAVLTLANGSSIVLDNAADGTLAQQGNANVVKLNDGQLLYKPGEGKTGDSLSIDHRVRQLADSPLTYNTLSTPRGGQYQLVLPDGSKVWLNAASSITFPTAFTGKDRSVKITGEAYFEVAHNSKMPFKVEKGNMVVEVLGTHFNVNAYEDEDAIKTTLLEGKVKVSVLEELNNQSANSNQKNHKPRPTGSSGRAQTKNQKLLAPGEQAVATAHSLLTIDHSPNLELVMAWKNGLFHFESVDIKTVMRQLSRWYDVDIVYKGTTVKNDPLFVEISRNTNLSDVLKALEVSGSARFSIEGKKIIVL